MAGGSSSGKTFLTKQLINKYGSKDLAIIPVDAYYKDLSHLKIKDREKNNFDHPDAFDFNLLISDLKNLEKEGTVLIPKYCYKTHTRKNEKQKVIKKKIIIIEGIFSLYNKKIREKMYLKIFVDVKNKIRFERRIIRDENHRNRTIKSIKEQYNKTVLPMYENYISPTMKYADLIIKNDENSYQKICDEFNKLLLQ